MTGLSERSAGGTTILSVAKSGRAAPQTGRSLALAASVREGRSILFMSFDQFPREKPSRLGRRRRKGGTATPGHGVALHSVATDKARLSGPLRSRAGHVQGTAMPGRVQRTGERSNL